LTIIIIGGLWAIVCEIRELCFQALCRPSKVGG
jgi:hypothetical protein